MASQLAGRTGSTLGVQRPDPVLPPSYRSLKAAVAWGILIREYWRVILPGLADVRIQELAGLTPAGSAARSR